MKFGATFLALMLLAGCSTIELTPRSETFLVTFQLADVHESAMSGNNSYYVESAWRAPLRTRQQVRRLARLHDLRQIDAWRINALDLHCVLFDADAGVDLATLFNEIEQHDFVVDAQPNHKFKAMTTRSRGYNDPLFDLQYGANTTSLRRLHTVTLGESSIVGLIDSNVEVTHPDLAGQVTKHHPIGDADTTTDKIHGTAMAGIIAATPDNGEGVVGIAPAAQVHAYGACRMHANRIVCRSFDIAKAIAHAIDDRVQIINMSLAGPDDALLKRLLTAAAQNYDMVIVAADNSTDPQENFPANVEFVHAAPDSGTLWFARFAQMSTLAGGGYQLFFGSSVASAGVTGIAALLRSQATARSTNEILNGLIKYGCDALPVNQSSQDFELSVLCD